ncbi:unnamed protein product [marine sediment metagenome]|uniref:Uncharacterized protein n=1 Tax=marine sediment metagenome TaxID=412755 RepID=X1MIG7_9ZZZZ
MYLNFSCADLPNATTIEDFKKIKERFLQEIQNQKEPSDLVNRLIRNEVKRVNLIGKIDLIIKKLSRDNKFSSKGNKYRKKLQNEPENYYNIIAELLTIEAFYDKGILEDIESTVVFN